MINEARIEDIKCRIKKIEKCKEEADIFLGKYLRVEHEIQEQLQESIRELRFSFEASHGDPRWTALVEEKYNLLLDAERGCSASIEDINKDIKVINKKCESDIEDLKCEMKMLGGVSYDS